MRVVHLQTFFDDPVDIDAGDARQYYSCRGRYRDDRVALTNGLTICRRRGAWVVLIQS